MSDKPFFDEYYNLWLLLSQTRSAIFKVRHKKVGQYLPPNQAAALVSIWEREGRITPLELSRRLFLEPNTVSEIISRMQKKGLVSKEKERQQGNVVRISITEKGLEVCKKVMGQDLIRHYMSKLTVEQQKMLWEILTVLYNTALKELGIEIQESPFSGYKV
jgi:DNA-binding MarR family transcriptional regulator